MPMMVDTAIEVFLRYTQNPKTIAIRINKNDTIATDALDALAATSNAPASSYFAPKVDATIEANAATTSNKVR